MTTKRLLLGLVAAALVSQAAPAKADQFMGDYGIVTSCCTLTSQLLATSGTQSLPGMAFTTDPSAGFWLSGGGNVVGVMGGVIHWFYGSSQFNVSVPAIFNSTIITTQLTPASSAATCSTGQISVDANFFYACTATNTWKRAAIITF